MSYVVLARKWRPQSFEDLVGQEHVSTTIGNAIAQNRVAHAFLFTGVRGVGKTTSARILAKALNCVQGPTATPCQVCPQCKEITVGSDVDVQEIDAASYTGVDDVRRLQESLPYRPQRDRFKIFIVDEVHMLSNAAWNAFLKTLEEPPPHVKFIFATTEVHKVPVTILSRCQRYDFKLISAQMIGARLRWVVAQENVAADDAALKAIAREAAGSMRDAMSLLDQVLASVGGEGERLTSETVSRVLGVADRVVLHRLAEALLVGDAGACVRVIGDLAREGYDLPHVAKNFLAHLRDLVVAKVTENPAQLSALLDLGDEEIAEIKVTADRHETDDLVRLHQGFSKSFDDIVRGGQPRASLEMTLVRLSRRPPLLPIDELLRRLGDLERRLNGPAPAGGGGSGPSAGPGGGGRPTERGGFVPGPAPGPGGQPRRPSAAPFGSPPASASPPYPGLATARPQHTSSNTNAGAEVVPLRPTASAVVSGNVALAAQPAPFVAKPPQPSPAAAPRRPSHPPSSSAPIPAVPPPPAASNTNTRSNASSVDLSGWRAVLDRVRDKRPALASVLGHAALLRFGRDRVEIGYELNSFLAGQAGDPVAREILLAALQAHFGAAPELSFETIATKAGAMTVAQADSVEKRSRLDAAKRAVMEHPLVAAAIEALGAEIRDIKIAGDGDAS